MMSENKSVLERKEYYSSLLSIYGEMLPKIIKERMMMFYLDDYSITEISENENVSRAAIFESIKTGENRLEEYETKLKVAEKKYNILKRIDLILKEKNIEKKDSLLKEWKGELENGI